MKRRKVGIGAGAAMAAAGVLLTLCGAARADTDMEIQEKALRARELSQHGGMDHAMPTSPRERTGPFRGVFYGYLPCPEVDCDGIKMTLSLNARDRYLLVIQPARARNRESFEKGRYEWNEARGSLLLTPNGDAPPRRFSIKDAGSLLALGPDGKPLPGDQDRYLLERSDQADRRDVHIH